MTESKDRTSDELDQGLRMSAKSAEKLRKAARKEKKAGKGKAGSALKKEGMGEGAASEAGRAAASAKHAAAAAADLASGNIAGAAAKILKDEHIRKMLIIRTAVPVISILLLVTFFLYSLPTSTFETVDSYIDHIDELWEEEAAAGSHSDFVNEFLATLRVGGVLAEDMGKKVSEGAEKLWDSAVGKMKSGFSLSDENDPDSDIDGFSEDGKELRVAGEEDAEKETLTKKLQSCCDKLNKRESQLMSAVDSEDVKRQFENILMERTGGRYNSIDVSLAVQNTPVTVNEALKTVSFLMTQQAGSLDDVKSSALMKWIGGYGMFERKDLYTLGDTGVTYHAKEWHGTYMPQYLMEQKKQEETILNRGNNGEMKKADYKKYMAPAADVLIYVDCPPAEEIAESVVEDEYGTGHVTVNISIGMRTEEELALIAGIWQGPLNGDGRSGGREHPELLTSSLAGMTGGLSSGTYTGSFGAGDFGGSLSWPLPQGAGRITSRFGPRRSPTRGASSYHKGIDIGVPVGTPVSAVADGRVIRAGEANGYGKAVYIDHGNGVQSVYGHIRVPLVTVGQTVRKGEQIALSGNEGRSTGPHLHLTLTVNGTAVDPLQYFGIKS